jgi:hypothetical protein
MATIKGKLVLPLALALGTLGLLVMASTAGATHARPKGATPLRVPFVPAYSTCTAPNRTHGPPLAFPSCNPPVQASSFLTVGTPDANGATANSVAFMSLTVVPPSCCPPQDVTVSGSISDVRCKAGVSTCGSPNSAGGADYTGELQMNSTIRITDHNNAAAPGGGPDAATVVDIPFPVSMTCGSTADPSIGGICSMNTSPVAVGIPNGSTPARSNVEISQMRVSDGGADGSTATTPNTVFAVQGLFIP